MSIKLQKGDLVIWKEFGSIDIVINQEHTEIAYTTRTIEIYDGKLALSEYEGYNVAPYCEVYRKNKQIFPIIKEYNENI